MDRYQNKKKSIKLFKSFHRINVILNIIFYFNKQNMIGFNKLKKETIIKLTVIYIIV
jgi:hypothetical protein